MSAVSIGPRRRIVVGRNASRGGARRIDDPFVIAALIAVLLGVLWFAWLTAAPDDPGEDSADAGFAHDMIRHHAQAVDMAMIVYPRTDDPTLSFVAYDIATTQQAQIGIMLGMLDGWGIPTSGSDEPAMAWMGHPTEGLMPGMATADDIASLRALPTAEMEAQFLRLMIRHHQGGVLMAEAGLERAKSDLTRDLAEGIAASQQSEIDLFQQLLEKRGLPRVTDVVTLEGEAVPTHSDEPAEHANNGHGSSEEGEGFTAGTREALEATLRYLPITIGIFALTWLVIDALRRRSVILPRESTDLTWTSIAAVTLVLSATVHAGLTPEHFDERTSYGLFFASSVVVLSAASAAIVAWPTAPTYLAGAVVSLVMLVVWGIFRVVAPPGADAAENVDLIGLVTKAAEVVALFACIRLWLDQSSRNGFKEQWPVWLRSNATAQSGQ